MIVAIAMAVSLSAASDLTAADCAHSPKLQATWALIGRALRNKDVVTVKDRAQSILDACGDTDTGVAARVLLANTAMGEGRSEEALTLLKPLPDPYPGPTGWVTSWIRLQAYENQNNAAGFAIERTALLNAVDQALGDPSGVLHGRRIERFEVGPNHVVAYQAVVSQGTFVRRFEFMASTDAPLVEPQSFMVTDDMAAAEVARQMGQANPLIFVDRYTCDVHFEIGFVKTYSYDEAEALVVKSLQGSPVVRTSPPGPVKACHWPQFVTPGLMR